MIKGNSFCKLMLESPWLICNLKLSLIQCACLSEGQFGLTYKLVDLFQEHDIISIRTLKLEPCIVFGWIIVNPIHTGGGGGHMAPKIDI